MRVKSSLFTGLVVLLTLLLLAFMVTSFMKRPSAPAFPAEGVSAVSDEEYQSALAPVAKAFLPAYTAAADDAARLVVVETTLSQLLALRVPATYKDLHLELAVSLNLIRTQLSADAHDASEGVARWEKAVSSVAWF